MVFPETPALLRVSVKVAVAVNTLSVYTVPLTATSAVGRGMTPTVFALSALPT